MLTTSIKNSAIFWLWQKGSGWLLPPTVQREINVDCACDPHHGALPDGFISGMSPVPARAGKELSIDRKAGMDSS
jgi:hypothetical protein